MMEYYIGALFLFYPAWRICRRAGFDPKLALVVLVPFVGMLILVAYLAFGNWPAASGKEG